MTNDSAALNARAEEMFFGIVNGPPDVEPIASYHWLLENAPAFMTGTGMLILTRFADVEPTLRRRELGRGEESVLHLSDLPPELIEPVMARWKRTMVFANPPLHTRIRRRVAYAFGPHFVESLRDSIRARARELLDRIAEQPGGNFMDLVAYPLGTTVLGDLLGVPEEDRDRIMALALDAMKIFDPQTAAAELPACARAEIEMADYFGDLLEQRRREPRDDLLTRMVMQNDEDALDEIELVATAANLMNAGIDTAPNLLGNALHALLTHPDQLALLREDPGRIPRAVDELARFDPPLNLNPRTALEPCTVAGFDLEPGQIVVSVQGAANRDPRRFTDPDRLDVLRDEGPSLAFGGGIHSCLGAHVGPLEVQELLTELVTGFADVEASGPAVRRPGHNLRGYADLPVTLRR
ncbi:MAG TPA: cytochrome P450 [Thermomonospora sp.]|nr:cytochrome P450 [Thermomonospora sp.]